MNNEQELDQETIDNLLATANKELPGLDNPPPLDLPEEEQGIKAESATIQEPSPSEESTALPVEESISEAKPEKKSLFKDYSTKKIIIIIFILFTLVITIGGFLGYKITDHATSTKPPLEKLIQQGITFEEKNFVIHAGYGNKSIVTSFLEAGMPVDVIRTTDGWSPLIAASFYKKTEIVELLLEKQANVNLQDKYGKTALMQAAAMGSEDIVMALLKNGANPNLQDQNGRTALMEANSKKHAKIAQILINAGASPAPPTNLTPKAPLLSKTAPVEKLQTSPLPSNTSDETRLSTNKAGSVQIGMSIEDVQKKYPALTISDKYMDGSKKTIATIYIKDYPIPSLLLELSNGKLKLVSTISIYDEKFSTDKQITIRSTVGEIRKQYTINDIKIINNSLFLSVKSMKMLFELDLSKETIPKEWLDTGNPSSIPDDTQIKRIIIY